MCDAVDEADADVFGTHRGSHRGARSDARLRYVGSDYEPMRDEEGQIIYEWHFFSRCLAGLQRGWFSLPARLTRQFLETFDRRYGAVMFRCSDCRCGIGNVYPSTPQARNCFTNSPLKPPGQSPFSCVRLRLLAPAAPSTRSRLPNGAHPGRRACQTLRQRSARYLPTLSQRGPRC